MSLLEREKCIQEDMGLKVDAALRRGGSPDEAVPSSILIRGGELEEFMGALS